MGILTENGYIVIDRMTFTTAEDGANIQCECFMAGYMARDDKSSAIELPIKTTTLVVPKLEFVYPELVYKRVYDAIAALYPGSSAVFEEGQPISVFDEEGYDKNGFNLAGYNREGMPRRSLDPSKDAVYYNDLGPMPPPLI